LLVAQGRVSDELAAAKVLRAASAVVGQPTAQKAVPPAPNFGQC
jgi:hypothetical protein